MYEADVIQKMRRRMKKTKGNRERRELSKDWKKKKAVISILVGPGIRSFASHRRGNFYFALVHLRGASCFRGTSFHMLSEAGRWRSGNASHVSQRTLSIMCSDT